MKILLVVTKGDIGGAQKRMLDLATCLRENGEEVTVAVGETGDWLPDQLEAEDLPQTRFHYLSRSNPVKIIAWWIELWQYLREEDFDVVHFNSSSALSGTLPARLADDVKTVFTFRGLSIISPNYPAIRLLKWFYWLAFKLFLPFLHVGVFQCRNDRAVAEERGLAPQRSVVIRPGIDPSAVGYLEREAARRELTRQIDADLSGKQMVGTIGRLSAQKNYGFLLDAFERVVGSHDDAMLVIVGDGELRDELEQRTVELGVEASVSFAGSLPGAARLINAFDVFVLPSLYEGVSMTLTEAVHGQVPILASDVGGNRETLCNNEASLFPVHSIDACAEKLDRMLSDPSVRERATVTRDCAETLMLKNSSRDYFTLYEHITGS